MYGLEKILPNDYVTAAVIRDFTNMLKVRNYKDGVKLVDWAKSLKDTQQAFLTERDNNALDAVIKLYGILFLDTCKPIEYQNYCRAVAKASVHASIVNEETAELLKKHSRGMEARMRGIYKYMREMKVK